MLDLNRFDENNDTAVFPDKAPSVRTARAGGVINMSTQAVGLLAENTAQKGDILSVARVSAVQAAKQTGFLIPLCQPVALSGISVDFDIDLELARVKATATATTEGTVSVEMEALTAVNIALLTVYDMMKAVDKNMSITQIHLEETTGGKSGNFVFTNDFENIDF